MHRYRDEITAVLSHPTVMNLIDITNSHYKDTIQISLNSAGDVFNVDFSPKKYRLGWDENLRIYYSREQSEVLWDQSGVTGTLAEMAASGPLSFYLDVVLCHEKDVREDDNRRSYLQLLCSRWTSPFADDDDGLGPGSSVVIREQLHVWSQTSFEDNWVELTFTILDGHSKFRLDEIRGSGPDGLEFPSEWRAGTIVQLEKLKEILDWQLPVLSGEWLDSKGLVYKVG